MLTVPFSSCWLVESIESPSSRIVVVRSAGWKDMDIRDFALVDICVDGLDANVQDECMLLFRLVISNEASKGRQCGYR